MPYYFLTNRCLFGIKYWTMEISRRAQGWWLYKLGCFLSVYFCLAGSRGTLASRELPNITVTLRDGPLGCLCGPVPAMAFQPFPRPLSAIGASSDGSGPAVSRWPCFYAKCHDRPPRKNRAVAPRFDRDIWCVPGGNMGGTNRGMQRQCSVLFLVASS